jgi:hypothetical protein
MFRQLVNCSLNINNEQITLNLLATPMTGWLDQFPLQCQPTMFCTHPDFGFYCLILTWWVVTIKMKLIFAWNCYLHYCKGMLFFYRFTFLSARFQNVFCSKLRLNCNSNGLQNPMSQKLMLMNMVNTNTHWRYNRKIYQNTDKMT